jgi:hypothetical protein
MTPIYNIIDNWQELSIWVKLDTIKPNKNWWINFTCPKKNIKREIVSFGELDNINNF